MRWFKPLIDIDRIAPGEGTSARFPRLADLVQTGISGITASRGWSYLLPLALSPFGFMISAFLCKSAWRNFCPTWLSNIEATLKSDVV
ncbi:hypothetical protein [Rhizobium sp. WYJ-E13]|uniref:hypothetical protein n=1 Tax=Rhizobium sp. WYJ-E13 TaxID=2849093 RepID=UPI001C1EEBF0|nr:hypothetical protein [Rhizobium sp. WYJ-E13]QWW71510.1 hypothetical protein KQ933_23020 [Rhizobium sp. WYJ-E13]